MSSFSDTLRSSYVSSISVTANSSDGLEVRDLRTDNPPSAAGGGGALVATWRTNTSATDTQTESISYSWRAAPTMSVSTNAGAALDIDNQRTSYTVTVSYANLTNDSTVDTHTLTPGTGFGTTLTDQTQGRNTTHTISSAVIQHNDTVTGSVAGDLIRPAGVAPSGESAADRTLDRTGSWSSAVATRYPWWIAFGPAGEDASDFAATDLGTLANSGYPADSSTYTTTRQTSVSSTTGWRGNIDVTNPNSTASTAFIIVPSTATWTVRQPVQGPLATTNNTITLGHTGATVTYNVYAFPIQPSATVFTTAS